MFPARWASVWVALALAGCARDIRVLDDAGDEDRGVVGRDADTDAAEQLDALEPDARPVGEDARVDAGSDGGVVDGSDVHADASCVQQCGGRRCGPDPACGMSCGMCDPGDSCLADGSCFTECAAGSAVCTADGFGYQSCGQNDLIGARDLGPRIGCGGGAACAQGRCENAQCIPVQVMLVVDRSASLSANSAWVWVRDELLRAVSTREHVGAYGLRTFPEGSCAPGALLAANQRTGAMIGGGLTAPGAEASSPIAAALTGVEQGFSGADDGRAVFLLTDGADTCAAAVESEAIVSRLHRSGVRTYTFALSSGADRAYLDRLARVGGTGSSTRAYDASALRRALEGALTDLGACRDPHAKVVAGGYHSCATYPDGHIACWGRNSSQQLEAPVAGVYHAIAAATDATCAVAEAGHLACWGRNDHGEIINPPGTSFVDVTGGDSHFCALRRDGTVACWGNNSSGQGTPPAGETFTQITAGGFFTCGLRADHTVRCWGSGAALPQGYKAIDGGSFSMCGLTLDDAVECSGLSSPRPGPYSSVSDGDMHSCAIRSDGSIDCWGSDFMGMSTPPTMGRFIEVDAGYEHTCAVREDDRIFCFGADFEGQSTPP